MNPSHSNILIIFTQEDYMVNGQWDLDALKVEAWSTKLVPQNRTVWRSESWLKSMVLWLDLLSRRILGLRTTRILAAMKDDFTEAKWSAQKLWSFLFFQLVNILKVHEELLFFFWRPKWPKARQFFFVHMQLCKPCKVVSRSTIIALGPSSRGCWKP